MASAKPLSISPPKTKIEINAKSVVNDVIMVLDKVSFIEILVTSLTTLLALISIFVLGGEILRGFALAMIIGVIIGTYSSIFVASPILKYLKVSYKTIAKDQENN
jgi:preprotein translocase subunit SecD